MPALYPENVQYSTPSTQHSPLGKALSGALNVAQRTAPIRKKSSLIDPNQLSQLISEAQQRILSRQAPTGPSIYEIARGTVPSSPEHGEVATYPLGASILKPEGKTRQIPPEYQTWKADEEGRWVTPTEKAKIVSIPETLGAGEYIIDPSQAGKLIKSERDALTDPNLFQALSPEDKMKMSMLRSTVTGGSPDIQLDHIIPLWAGGANTFENLQPLRIDQHATKTKIQSVPFTLFTQGKINKNKALLMAQQWQYISDNFDINKIPGSDETGSINLKTAEELSKEWEGTPHVTWNKFWKEIPLARRAMGEKVGEVGDKNLPSFLSGALKGFTQEATMGVIPTPEAKGTSENIGRIVGSALGFLVPFMGTVSLVSKIGSKLGLKALRIGKGTLETEKVAKPLYDLKRLPYVEGAKIPLEYIDKTKQVLVNNVLKNAGTFAAYGQLRTTMPTLFGDPDPGLEERTKQLVFDSIFGGITGTLSQNFSSYAKLGGLTLGLGLMETGNVNDSFTQALTMMALHRIGPIARTKEKSEAEIKTKDFMDKLTADMEVKANETAVQIRSTWLPKEYEWYREKGVSPKKLTSEKINTENDIILDKASSLVKEGRISPEDYERIKVQAITSGKQLLDGGQSELIRKRNAIREIVSTADALKKREQGMNFSTPDELIKIGENAPRDFIISNEDISSFEPIMKARVTGMADQIDPVTAENQKRFQKAKKENRASSQVYLVRRDNMEPLVRKINQGISPKEIDEKLHKPSEKPWNNVEVYGVIINPNNQLEFLRLGWVPRGFRIDGSKLSINQGIRNLNERLKSNFSLYDSKHNKDLVADFLRKNNAKIGTAHITGIGMAKESGQPWTEITLTEKGIRDAQEMKKWYEGMDMAEKVPEKSVRGALVEANNNPTSENAVKVIQSIAEKRYLDPVTEIDVSLNESGIKSPLDWVIVREISNFFNYTFSGNKNLIKNKINEKFGDIIDDVQAKKLSEESGNIGWRDIGKVLHDGIKSGKANTEAKLTYSTILSFFKSPEYRSSELSSYFADIPFVGVGKNIMKPIESVKASIPTPIKEGQEVVFEGMDDYGNATINKGVISKVDKESVVINGEKISKADILPTTEPVEEKIVTKKGVELKKETLPTGQYWLEQNVAKEGSKWAKLAKEGHKIEHLLDKKGYVGNIRVDGKEYTYKQAEKKFLKPKGIYDSATVAEAPEVISTPSAKKEIIKRESSRKKFEDINVAEVLRKKMEDIKKKGGLTEKLSSEEFVKMKAAEKKLIVKNKDKIIYSYDVYKEIYSRALKRMDTVNENPGKERIHYLKRMSDAINDTDAPYNERIISKEEYNRIKNSVFDDLKTKALDEVEIKFPAKGEIIFQKGSIQEPKKEIGRIRLENERLINTKREKKTKEELLEEEELSRYKEIKEKEKSGEEILPEEIDFLINKEGVSEKESDEIKDRISTFQKVEKMKKELKEQGKSDKEIKATATEMWTEDGLNDVRTLKEYKKQIDDAINNYPKTSPTYVTARSFNDYLVSVWGPKWQENSDLGQFFSTRTYVGRSFWEDLFKQKNENNYPFSQPKSVVVALSQKPYEKMSKEKNEVYGKRKKELEETQDEIMSNLQGVKYKTTLADAELYDAIRSGARIEDPSQSTQDNIKDLTFLEMRMVGRLSPEADIALTPEALMRDNRSFLPLLVKRYNNYITRKRGKKVFYDQKVLDKIDEKIKKDIGDIKELKSVEEYIKEYDTLKRSVESMEGLKEKGELPDDVYETLQKNKKILEKLKRA